MISNNERLVGYLDTLINSVFKVLPLYEESNEGVDTYIESLIFELYGLENVVNMESSFEYISLLSTLESIKKEVAKTNSEKKIVKREVFKSINIIKTMLNKIEGV